MASQTTSIAENKKKIWSADLRPKVGQSVTHLGRQWVSLSGVNSEPTLSNTNDWLLIGRIIDEQIIALGGNYNNLEINAEIIQFTNTNAQAIVNGLNFNAYKRITLINNSDFDVRLNAESANSDENKRIKLPTGLTNMGIQGTTELVYVDSIERWQIVDSFASKYRPEHRGLNEFEVEVVGPSAISETREIAELIITRASQTTNLSKANLNTLYPDSFEGQMIFCRQINLIYIKSDVGASNWQSIPLTDVS